MLKIGSSFIAWMNGFHIAAQRLEQRSRARQGELHPHRAGRNSETAAITITTVAFSVYAIRPIVCKIAAVCIIHGPASEDAVALADRAQIRPIAYECQNLVVLGQHLCLIDVCETSYANKCDRADEKTRCVIVTAPSDGKRRVVMCAFGRQVEI